MILSAAWLLLVLQAQGGIHFDATITLGNVFTMLLFLFAAIKFWSVQVETRKDLEWRISNLETWRREHTVDADSRDNILRRMEKILYHVTNGREGKE